MFKDRLALRDLYQRLLRHATLSFGAEDVMTFLGKKLKDAFAGEISIDARRAGLELASSIG
jgi:hypothetical protein